MKELKDIFNRIIDRSIRSFGQHRPIPKEGDLPTKENKHPDPFHWSNIIKKPK